MFSFGAVYAQRLTHGQFEWIAIAWVPFVLIAIDRMIERPTLRAACGGGVFYSLIVLDGGPYQFAFFGVFLAIYAGVRAIELRNLRPLVGLASLGGVAVGIAAIKLIPVFELVGRYPRATSEDPFYGAPFTPGTLDVLYQMFLSRAQAHDPELWMPYVLNVGSYVGVVPLLLAGFAVVALPRKHLSWILSGFIALWISLGPAAPIDLWHYLHQLPGLSMLRVPSRFNVYALLCIALLAGAGGAGGDRGADLERPAGRMAGGRRIPKRSLQHRDLAEEGVLVVGLVEGLHRRPAADDRERKVERTVDSVSRRRYHRGHDAFVLLVWVHARVHLLAGAEHAPSDSHPLEEERPQPNEPSIVFGNEVVSQRVGAAAQLPA